MDNETSKFETALLKINVSIDEIIYTDRGLLKAIGYIQNKKYVWDKNGNCNRFSDDEPEPKFDIKL